MIRLRGGPQPTDKPVWRPFTVLGTSAFISDRSLTDEEWEDMWGLIDSLGVNAHLWDASGSVEVECKDDKSFVILKLALM